ncbi:sensor histidine kinase [Mycobacterium sp. NPDC051804]|uniref:sensor histidine kinase n=1 Tax=Mycobacterium sp. NPDC051804 TaxID=3364295 RepID=UPI0037B0C4E8
MFGVSALVTLCVLAVGAISIYSMQTYVAETVDTEIGHSLAAFKRCLDEAQAQGRSGTEALTEFTGQASGTTIAIMRDGRVVESAFFDDDKNPAEAPTEAVRALEATRWIERPQTVNFGTLGKYRVASEEADGQQLISAVSMRSASEIVARKTIAVAVITASAALMAAVGTVVLVRLSLRPLRRVAATASNAADTALRDGDQRITARVRRSDSHPDNEVGIVGETLNRLLANVDATLAGRAESDRRMRQFLSDASHELRTPLAAIHGYAQLTRQDGPSLPSTTEYALGRIESESRRMSTLVSDMLLLSRLDERRGLHFERVDITEVVHDAINDVAVTAPEHTFVAELPEDDIWIWGDRANLHQIITNLLVNARVHTPAGVTVTSTLRSLGDTVELSVADDGPGIDPQLLPDLFGRFVRADKARSRATESSGLGLAIVASIAKAHGGRVGVESRPGRTEFVVTLPAMAPAALT